MQRKRLPSRAASIVESQPVAGKRIAIEVAYKLAITPHPMVSILTDSIHTDFIFILEQHGVTTNSQLQIHSVYTDQEVVLPF